MTAVFAPGGHYEYRDGTLYCENVNLAALAREFGTPLYVYSKASILENFQTYQRALEDIDHKICYAVKANSNIAVLSLLAKAGANFDIVSAGELARVLKAGGNPAGVVFSGVGKTEEEIRYALINDVGTFNIESVQELDRLESLARALNKKPRIYIRVNPDVDAHTHPHISTGLQSNKFGVSPRRGFELFCKAKQSDSLIPAGIDCHIGSQLTDYAPYFEACEKLLDMLTHLRDAGIELEDIDFGGGVGVSYRGESIPPLTQLVNGLKTRLTAAGFGHLRLVFEPGRSIVAASGVLMSEVQYIKKAPSRNFAVLDAGMTDLIRPALYDAWMPIVPVEEKIRERLVYDVVGPVCESSDRFDTDRELLIGQGDLVAIGMAGAYAMSMSSRYNSRPRAAEILVNADQAHVIRRREQFEDLWALESLE